MSLCNNQMGDFTVSQSRRFTETMGVGHEAIKTENKAWIPGAPEVVCQHHFTDSDYRPIKPFGE